MIGKTAKNNLCLVTDLSCLNQHINRPSTPFLQPKPSSYHPSTLHPSMPFLAIIKFLSMNSHHISPHFYCHLDVSCTSGHQWAYEWCRRSDVTIKNIPSMHKLVYDYLITADTMDELTKKNLESIAEMSRTKSHYFQEQICHWHRDQVCWLQIIKEWDHTG